MRAGTVVRMRLSPQDCMSVIDLLEGEGMSLSRIGISNAASIAMSILLREKRKAGVIPVRGGYEYLSMMSKLDSSGNTKEKQAVTDALYKKAMKGDGEEITTAITDAMVAGARWVDDMFLPQEYDAWDDVKQWYWRTAQQALLDEGKECMMSADGWVAPTA